MRIRVSWLVRAGPTRPFEDGLMTDGRKTAAGRRRWGAVRLRSETASGEVLGAMAQELGKELAIDQARAREILLRLGRRKHSAA